MTHAHVHAGSHDRFHYLDALRAWSMLLGIVLHAAWLLVPFSIMCPMQDCDAHPSLGWLFTLIHMFRMQVFFLLAGFFANLIYVRKGLRGFLRHRAVRIGIPLVGGWAILFPWCSVYYVWGGQIAGRLRNVPDFWLAVWSHMSTSLDANLGLLHLWFLYDLIWIYLGTVLGKLLLDHVLDRRQRWRNAAASALQWAVGSPANTLLLAVPSTLLLLPGRYWIGVEGYPDNIVPEWSGLLQYWLFFLVGWLAFSHREILHALHVRWGLQLAVGIAISFGIWGFQWHFSHRQITFAYPAVVSADIHDYPAIRAQLLVAQTAGPQHPAHVVWDALPPEWQTFVQTTSHATVDELDGLGAQLNERVVFGASFASIPPSTPSNASERPTATQSPLENRRTLEVLFAGAIAERITDRPEMIGTKVLYCLAYAIGMWALVFGTLGMFHAWLSTPSAAMRYLADSSYWLYLLHIPVLFQVEMWIGRFPLSPAGKFACYNLVAVAVLLPSYHYLVRSTFVGQILNGHTQPFTGFWRSPLFGTAARHEHAKPVAASPEAT